MSKHIFLIGFMGVGKTTLGKKLANKLNIPFIDTDQLIEKEQNESVSNIFKEKGETYFRELETKLLLSLKEKSHSVVSTGGGLPCFGNNLTLMKSMGKVIYLERNPKELAHRLFSAKKKRPLIEHLKTKETLTDYIEMKLNERNIFYKQADLIIAREFQTLEVIISSINTLF